MMTMHDLLSLPKHELCDRSSTEGGMVPLDVTMPPRWTVTGLSAGAESMTIDYPRPIGQGADLESYREAMSSAAPGTQANVRRRKYRGPIGTLRGLLTREHIVLVIDAALGKVLR